ncbi:3191_t:CDS:2 [Diversispora eburnea]|uniref:3191_t:CDS:1 n=1 Tax=Diversispora eburnea TaxID=1213867 RepID=A0A9N9BJ95_9GLOM|nr:3191_t:CDS:2 [Diversispora eburnea]
MTEADYNKITSFAIYPPLGAEICGVYVGKGNTKFEFKDSQRRVRPHSVRYRIYGFDEKGEVVREIKLADRIKGTLDISITWTVELANKKSSHAEFVGIEHFRADILRNKNWEGDRKELEAIDKKSLSSDGFEDLEDGKRLEESFKANIYGDKAKLDLGKMIMEKEGSSLIIGGKGKSGKVE